MIKMKTLKIAVVAVFAMAIATLMTQPAQAKFTLLGGYKYVGIGGLPSGYALNLHGAKFHFLWSKGRHDENRPRHLLGFGVGAGAGTGKTENLTFFDLSFNYEYVFPFGLGLSAGLGVTGVGAQEGEIGGDAGGGVSDLGLRYHFKNGFVLSTTVDLQSSPLPGTDLLYGVNVGLGYEF